MKEIVNVSFVPDFESWDTLKERVAKYDIPINWSNFKRCCDGAKYAIIGGIWAIGAANWSVEKSSIALLGVNGRACALENRQYYEDYCANQKIMGRGRLFVGTLPSIPVCEVAIALQISGEVLYCQGNDVDIISELLLLRHEKLLTFEIAKELITVRGFEA